MTTCASLRIPRAMAKGSFNFQAWVRTWSLQVITASSQDRSDRAIKPAAHRIECRHPQLALSTLERFLGGGFFQRRGVQAHSDQARARIGHARHLQVQIAGYSQTRQGVLWPADDMCTGGVVAQDQP